MHRVMRATELAKNQINRFLNLNHIDDFEISNIKVKIKKNLELLRRMPLKSNHPLHLAEQHELAVREHGVLFDLCLRLSLQKTLL